MKKISFFLSALVLGLGLASCEKQLDIPQKSVLDYGTYYAEAGDTEALIRHLRKCRCIRMEELHESQRKVDCLDFLIRQTAKTIQ